MRLRWLLAATCVSMFAVPATSAHAAAPTLAFPTITTSGWNRSSSPVIADVDGNGVADIVMGHEDGWVRVIDAATGRSLPHWPQPAVMGGPGPTAIDGSPAVGDLNHDGHVEVVVGVGSVWQKNHQGGVIVFNNTGSMHCRFRTKDLFNVWNPAVGARPDGYDEGVYSTPALGDIDGDGNPDIVFGGWDHEIHAIDRNCHELRGFPYFVDDTVWSSPALYDIDHDGRLEIVIGNDQTAGGPDNWAGGEVRALDWQNGTVRELWRRQVHDVIQSSPAIGDINGDGRSEVIVGAGDYYHNVDGHKVYAFDVHTGANVPGWPTVTGGVTFSSPALGDLDGDGRAEVVIGSSDGYVHAFKGNGGHLWATRLLFNGAPGGPVTASPIIADMNGDGHNDVGVGNNWGFFVLDGRTGAILSQLNPWLSYEAAGAVGNFGAQGWKLVVSGFNTPGHTSTTAVYSIPTPGVSPPWPMFHRAASHIGAPVSGGNPLPPNQCSLGTNAAPKESSNSAAGYWILDRRGSVYAFGSAKSYGSLPSLRISGGAAAITNSPAGHGYWIMNPAGGVFSFGDAHFYGSMGGKHVNSPIIGMSSTRSGRGYWLLGRDGGVFSFGDAHFYGSMGGKHLNAPIIALAPTITGHGYWLLARDGGVFSFGDARFFGSTGGLHLNSPVISMAAGPGGVGYWLLAGDGGVFSFHVKFYGSVPGSGLCLPPASRQIRSSTTGHGYWVLATSGQVFHFGDARYFGSELHPSAAAVDVAILK